MTFTPALDENYNADCMDALADMHEEQDEVMRDTDPDDWMGYDDWSDGCDSIASHCESYPYN